jgi:PhnB protein
VGGHWLYGMIVPMAATGSEKGQIHWGKQEYEKIVPYESFSGTDVFCDENGIINPKLPEGKFENLFHKVSDEKTQVTLISTQRSFEDVEAVIAMGYKEGIAVCFNQLDDLFK